MGLACPMHPVREFFRTRQFGDVSGRTIVQTVSKVTVPPGVAELIGFEKVRVRRVGPGVRCRSVEGWVLCSTGGHECTVTPQKSRCGKLREPAGRWGSTLARGGTDAGETHFIPQGALGWLCRRSAVRVR